MTEADIEIVLQCAKEQYPGVKPRIISDNGPQFIAKDFKEVHSHLGHDARQDFAILPAIERPRRTFHRTHNDEFYEVQADSDQLSILANSASGANLQLHPPTPIPRLPDPTRIHTPLETQPRKGKVSLIYWTSTGSGV